MYIVLDLPTTARPIRVMSVKDLYIMRVYELGECRQAMQKLLTKLWTFVMEKKEKNEDTKDAKIGDVSFILNALCAAFKSYLFKWLTFCTQVTF